MRRWHLNAVDKVSMHVLLRAQMLAVKVRWLRLGEHGISISDTIEVVVLVIIEAHELVVRIDGRVVARAVH